MRRTPEETALSETILNSCDVAGARRRGCRRTARPNNRLSSSRPIESTRTSSPYFSPNSAIAPAAIASSGVISRVVDRLVGADLAFTSASIAAISSRRQRLGVREIEPQAVGRDQAALLGDMAAEPVAQRRVQQVGRAVVGADARRGARRRPTGGRSSPTLTSPCDDLGAQCVKLAERLRRVLNIALEALERGQFSGVADLAAALAVEGRLVEDDR